MQSERMKNKTILVCLICLIPNTALASDPTALIYLMLGQVVLFLWPILTPLLFLKGASNKLKVYGMFLIMTYGLLGIAGLPLQIAINFTLWTTADTVAQWAFVVAIIQNTVAFLATVILLWAIGPKLVKIF